MITTAQDDNIRPPEYRFDIFYYELQKPLLSKYNCPMVRWATPIDDNKYFFIFSKIMKNILRINKRSKLVLVDHRVMTRDDRIGYVRTYIFNENESIILPDWLRPTFLNCQATFKKVRGKDGYLYKIWTICIKE